MRPAVQPHSALLGLAVELYQRHIPDGYGGCACGTPRCPVPARAAQVIRAAGLDPRRFDAPVPEPPTIRQPVVAPRRLPHREPGLALRAAGS